ncbi:ABC transporter permease [Halalkalibaculum sp. DA384]|uniref:ABC transporter permease n=1 Tax=Halalkalibaculum sp. DA384 TaxID=3373606 RepID=UPI0037549FB7
MAPFWSSWTWKMAWRDARSNKKRLFLYISAIIIGVAAQVAITSFRESLTNTIDNQSRELLGADLEIEAERPFSDEELAYFDSLGGEQSKMIEFNSMAYLPESGGTRLSQIRAIQGDFPFYGEILTNPPEAVRTYRQNNTALLDNALMVQFGTEVGDSVRIGNVTFEISGGIEQVPGEAAAVSMVGPRIFIPYSMVDSTGLVQRGSFVEYKMYFKFDDGRDMAQMRENTKAFMDEHDLRYDDVAERREEMGEAVGNLAKFLNLVGFVALLLGGIGVASAIHLYIKQKISTAAVLRCFGATSNQTMTIFLIQALVLGLTGALAGTVLGVSIQYMLPQLVSDFLPVDVDLTISWLAVALGLLTGTGVALVFALMPLLSLRKASPLYALRTMNETLTNLLGRKTKWSIYGIIVLTVAGYATLITEDWMVGGVFTIGMIVAFGLLLLVARGLMWFVKRYFPSEFSYVWRQGLANLYRPNNQTATLLLSLGLGMLLISTLYFSQDMLMSELNFATRDDSPNLILFDIQPDQNEGVRQIMEAEGIPILQNVPIVTMRISSYQGRTVEEIREDTSSNIRGWALDREYRSTYRDSLLDSETLVEGEWIGEVDPETDVIPVSAAKEITEDLNAGIGDTLTFNVQGLPVKAYIASIREVDFQRVQPNFFMVFPKGVLEQAPQIGVIVTRTSGRDESAQIQQQVVQKYPNVSAIDVGLILQTINEFIDKISFAIQFMALFSILTGLIVLASSVAISRLQRIKESVLLRTLGASKKQIIQILSIEYFFLGVLGAFTGLILSVLSTWLLGYFYFDLTFIPNIWVIIIGTLAIAGLTILIGMLNSRSVYQRPPLEVLRLETA